MIDIQLQPDNSTKVLRSIWATDNISFVCEQEVRNLRIFYILTLNTTRDAFLSFFEDGTGKIALNIDAHFHIDIW